LQINFIRANKKSFCLPPDYQWYSSHKPITPFIWQYKAAFFQNPSMFVNIKPVLF
jgi:hypothetical protein